MAAARGSSGWSAFVATVPAGAFTVDSGTKRCLLAVVISEYTGGITVTGCDAGGMDVDQIYRSFLDKTGSTQDTTIHFLLWKEADINQFGALNFANFAFTAPDGSPVHANHVFSYCTFTGLLQSAIATFTSAVSQSGDSVAVTTDSTADDYIIAAGARASATRSFSNWDSLTEVFDVGGTLFRRALADGLGGDGTTTVTGDGTADDMNVGALVLHADVAAPAGTVPVTQVGDFGVIYDNEVKVIVLGGPFGASQGTGGVMLHDYDPRDIDLSGTDVAQTETAWTDGSITITVDKGALSGDSLFLSVTTNGGEIGVIPVVVRNDPGAGQVVLRVPGPEQSYTVGGQINIDTSNNFFASDAQDRLAFSSSTLAPGLAVNGKLLTGTIAPQAVAGSPYSTTIRLTDGAGAYIEDTFTHTITVIDPNPDPEPPPSVKTRAVSKSTRSRQTVYRR